MPDCKCNIAGDGGDKSARIADNKARIDFLFGIGAYTSKTDPALNAITTADVDDFLGCAITLTAAGNNQTLPSPTVTSTWHSFTVLNDGASTDNITIIGGSSVLLEPGESTNFIWVQTAWVREDDSGIFIDDGTTITPQGSPRAISSQSFQFDTAYSTAIAEGEIAWDTNTGTLRIGMPGGSIVLQTGQEMFLPDRPKNVEGSQIDKGELVYIFDAGASVPQVKLASASDYNQARATIAMATEDVPDNNRGYFTTFGIVRDVNTNAYSEGTILYLDTVAGGYTDSVLEPPNANVEIGIVIRQSSDEGMILVTIDFSVARFVNQLLKEPTGFDDPEDVIINYDDSTRKVTLTGTVEAYYRGVPFTDLSTGYLSPAHTAADGVYLLVYDGSTISWKAPGSVKFYDLLIAFAIYKTTYEFGMRECHGLMPWQTHKESDEVIGTHKESGGDIGAYTLASTTAADRRPSVSAAVVDDEDLPSSLPQLAAEGTYTQCTLSASGTTNFDTTAVDIVPLSTNQPYWNELSGGTWGQTLMSVGYRMSIWLLAIPVTADTESQKYRFSWIQGQEENQTLAGEQGVTPNSLNMGDLTGLVPEFVVIGRVIIRYLGGNWTFEYVEAIDGTQFSQSGSASGGLSTVTVEAPLEGEGTVSVPLALDQTIVVNDQAGNYALLISDAAKLIRVDTTVTDYAVTFPQDSTENIPIDSWGEIKNIAANELGITKGAGATFESEFGDVNLKVIGTYGFSAFWHKTAADTFEISGSVAAA